MLWVWKRPVCTTGNAGLCCGGAWYVGSAVDSTSTTVLRDVLGDQRQPQCRWTSSVAAVDDEAAGLI